MTPSILKTSCPRHAKAIAIIGLLAFASTGGTAQVSLYTFSKSMGTYAPITGGVELISGTSLNNQVFNVTLPSPFWFNGASYPVIHVSCNGFITLGSAPGGTNYDPLSSTQVYAGAIAPFGSNLADANRASSSVRWEQVGREVVVQWRHLRRVLPGGNERFSFQARLNLDNGVIKFVYGSVDHLGSSVSNFPQIGLRGADNTFPLNVVNRMVDPSVWWPAPLQGIANDSRCRFTSTSPVRQPANGLTYTWTWSAGMELELVTDNNGAQTSWEILPDGSTTPVCSGSGYADNTTYIIPCLAAAGKYRLLVKDSYGDGLCCANGVGGYILRDVLGRRIIDEIGNGQFTVLSSVLQPFDTPLGKDRLTALTSDQVNLFPSEHVQAVPDPDVQAQYGIGSQTNDGYQFWFFDPNGGYSRRLFMQHSANNYMFPSGPDRCSYLKIGNMVTNPLPLNIMLNIKVRSVVNGVYRSWGEASRIKVDLPARCPSVQLIDDITSPHHSCGITNVPLNSSRWLRATFVHVAHGYKFLFTAPGYSRQIVSTTNSSLLMVRWATMPLQYGTQYNVQVTTTYDNGATWCPYGPVCTITTAVAPPADGPGERSFTEFAEETTALALWPNPTNGGPLWVSLDGLDQDVNTIAVQLHDAGGRLVLQQDLPAEGGQVRASMDLVAVTAKGLHLLTIDANGERITRRVVID